ncbi:MAG: SBBP repeat-containing protein [Thermoplasmatota archaeon]
MRYLSSIFALVLICLSMIMISDVTGTEKVIDACPFPMGDLGNEHDIATGNDIDMGPAGCGFIENLGQYDEDILYYTSDGSIILKEGSFWLNLKRETEKGTIDGHAVSVGFKDGDPLSPKGTNIRTARYSYFSGSDPDDWVKGAASYGSVIYQDVWDDIDIVFSSDGDRSKYDIILHPGSDPDDIIFDLTGHESISIKEDDLRIGVGDNLYYSDKDLYAHYIDGDCEMIRSSFKILGPSSYGFSLDGADPERGILIDPVITSTYLGASDDDFIHDMDMDSSGNVYVTGRTVSNNFPTTPGAYDTSLDMTLGHGDVFISKLKSDLTTLIYSTFVGHSYEDTGKAIDIDQSGNAYVAGMTRSNLFPTTDGAYQSSGTNYNGDVFVLKLNPSGTGLVYSTFVRGTGYETVGDIEVDGSGNAIVGGTTESSDFPTVPGCYDTSRGPPFDAFLFKLSQNGGSLLFSTFLGGNGNDYGEDVELGSSGDVLFALKTASDNIAAPSGAFCRTNTGNYDAFIARFNSAGTTLKSATYYGGTDTDELEAMELDEDGNIYICGSTISEDIPLSPIAYQNKKDEGHDAFVAIFNPNMRNLLSSSYLGGSGNDYARDIELDSSNEILVIGDTHSNDYPITEVNFDDQYNNGETFISRFHGNCTELDFSSYWGGGSSDMASSAEVDSFDRLMVAGYTESGNFFGYSGAYDTTKGQARDGFISKFNIPKRPSTPKEFGGIFGPGFINLTWEYPHSDGGLYISNYTIYRRTDIAYSTVSFELGPVYNFNDTSITEGVAYYYWITCTNGIAESEPSPEVRFADTIRPVMTGDESTSRLTTGEPFIFRVEAMDNINVTEVTAAYWYGSNFPTNISLVNTEDDWWENNITLMHTNLTFSYVISIKDVYENWNSYDFINLSIIDNDDPSFTDIYLLGEPTTGENIDFWVEAVDNIDVIHSELEFWYDDTHNIRYMSYRDEKYTYSLKTPHIMGNLTYRVLIFDGASNMNISTNYTIEVVDNDPPIIVSDSTPSNAMTGDDLVFSAVLTDNVGIGKVLLEYSYGDQEAVDVEMTSEDGSNFSYVFSVPMEIGNLEYRYIIYDLSENVKTFNPVYIQVDDDVPPEMELISDVPKTIGAGLEYTIYSDITEYNGLLFVDIDYWFDDEEHYYRSMMEEPNGTYSFTIDIPETIGTLSFFLNTSDRSYNENRSDVITIDIVDLTKPEIQDIDDLTVYCGQRFSVELEVSDDIGIASIEWEGLPSGYEGMIFKGYVNISGEYNVQVVVTDMGGNSVTGNFKLTVFSRDHDKDSDGVPDLVELQYGLDPEDPSDGEEDMDKDGLTNKEEAELGTDLSSSDTDGDGIPDLWEYENGLDPLRDDSEEDHDNDGISNIEEYRRSISGKDDEMGMGPIIIVIVIIIVMALAVTGVLFFFIRKRKDTGEPVEENKEEEKADETEKIDPEEKRRETIDMMKNFYASQLQGSNQNQQPSMQQNVPVQAVNEPTGGTLEQTAPVGGVSYQPPSNVTEGEGQSVPPQQGTPSQQHSDKP